MKKVKSFMCINNKTQEKSFIVLQEEVIVRNKSGMSGRNAKIRILKGPESLYKKPDFIYSEQQNQVKVLIEVIYNISSSKKINTIDNKIISDVCSLFNLMKNGEMNISSYEYNY